MDASPRQRPLVFITSSNEKELPDAFLHRCFFHYIRFPDEAEVIARRVRRLLARRGLLADDAGPPSDETPSALDAWQAASLRNVVAFGPRAGRPLRKIVLPLPPRIDRDRVGDGRLKYAFKHPWRDRTAAVIMDPLDFLARLRRRHPQLLPVHAAHV